MKKYFTKLDSDIWNMSMGEWLVIIEQETRAKLDRIKELNGGWLPKWEDIDSRKYYFYYNHVPKKIYINSTCFIQSQPNEYYIVSQKKAEKIRKEMYNDILLMLGVEE